MLRDTDNQITKGGNHFDCGNIQVQDDNHTIDDGYTASCIWLRISAKLLIDILQYCISIKHAQTSTLMLKAGANLPLNTTGAPQELCQKLCSCKTRSRELQAKLTMNQSAPMGVGRIVWPNCTARLQFSTALCRKLRCLSKIMPRRAWAWHSLRMSDSSVCLTAWVYLSTTCHICSSCGHGPKPASISSACLLACTCKENDHLHWH